MDSCYPYSEQINFAALQDRELAFVKSKFVIVHGMKRKGKERKGTLFKCLIF